MKEVNMNLRAKIDESYKNSIKSKNSFETDTLRLIRSAIKDKDIENRGSGKPAEINEQQILLLLQTLIKQRKDSIESFKVAARNDLVEKEEREIEIINLFLPNQLGEEEIKDIVEKYVNEHKLSSIKQMGVLMNFLKEKYSGTIDMSLAGKLVKQILNK
tara:strand:+ start:92 stop:568 length:477 start_codon:yes stop_codon:yes gene_type:complete